MYRVISNRGWVLESICCDNRQMLAAARDRNQDDIDVSKRLVKDGNSEGNDGLVAALFAELIFHNRGQVESDGLEDQEVYVEFGDDP